MLLDKAQVIDILRSLGKDTGPAQAELPDQIDTDEHSDLLDKLGISRGELLEQFGGSPESTVDGYPRPGEGDETEGDNRQDATLTKGVASGIAGLRGVGPMGAAGN